MFIAKIHEYFGPILKGSHVVMP